MSPSQSYSFSERNAQRTSCSSFDNGAPNFSRPRITQAKGSCTIFPSIRKLYSYRSGLNPVTSIAHILPVRYSSVKGNSVSGSAAPFRYNTSEASVSPGTSTAKLMPFFFLFTPGTTGSPLYAQILFFFSIPGSPCHFISLRSIISQNQYPVLPDNDLSP